MDKRHITLFVLSNDATKTRQIRIPFRSFKTLVAAAVVFALVLAAGIFDYARVRGGYSEYYSLRKENTAQKIELQGFASKIKDLDAQMAKLSLFDRKLRIMANIETPADAQSDQIMGMGGAGSEEDYLGSAGSQLDGLVGQMRSDIKKLEQTATDQESSFTELQAHLVKQASFFAATPSIWPTRGWVTSTYGDRISPFTGRPQMHKGLDIANRVGTTIVAPANGIVVRAGRDGGFGKAVVISHGYGVKTTYGHLSEVFVRAGQKVKRGDRIAAMGNTGRSTGPHLHYEVSLNGLSVNPSKYILN
ncbi:MAG: M23 family metallopeptidase [Deltaproteobacteria bacterium]|nr:M23 family metallopeptidase [Deltaproteobacteria bacterium]